MRRGSNATLPPRILVAAPGKATHQSRPVSCSTRILLSGWPVPAEIEARFGSDESGPDQQRHRDPCRGPRGWRWIGMDSGVLAALTRGWRRWTVSGVRRAPPRRRRARFALVRSDDEGQFALVAASAMCCWLWRCISQTTSTASSRLPPDTREHSAASTAPQPGSVQSLSRTFGSPHGQT